MRIFLGLFLVGFTACGTSDAPDAPSHPGPEVGGPELAPVPTDAEDPSATGWLRVQIHDAPADDVDQVQVVFDEVAVHHIDDGWRIVSTSTQQVDLLQLQGGVVADLGLSALPVGTYDEVRLHLTDAWVVDDGLTHPLDVPSGFTSGVKLKGEFEIAACGETVVDLDWDVGAHLLLNPQGYSLRPTLLLQTEYDDTDCQGCRVVDLPDPALDAAVRANMGVPTGPIDPADAAALVVLDGRNMGIASLAGLECFTSLAGLYLDRNQVSDLSPIASATNMVRLHLNNNQVIDLSPLSGMSQMNYLLLNNNPGIGDLSALSGMTVLEHLHAYNTGISDLSPLSSKPLIVFDGRLNTLSDLSPLAGTTTMGGLYLDNNQISDLSPTAAMTGMVRLQVANNQVTDLSPLSGMSQMNYLLLNNNPGIGDLSALSGMTVLEHLHAYNTGISSLGPLAGKPLIVFDGRVNSISDLSPLAGNAAMGGLYLDSNPLSDISPLAGMTSMVRLQIGSTGVTDLTPLSGMTQMNYLNLNHVQFTDLSVVSTMTGLGTLHLNSTGLSDTTPLDGMCSLYVLDVRGNAYSCPDAVLDNLASCVSALYTDC